MREGTFWAALLSSGSLMFGYDSGLLSTVIAQPEFISYFNNPTGALLGGIVSSYAAGATIGCVYTGYFGDRIGRKWTIHVGAVIALVGSLLQTASVNVEMLICGRAVTGFAIGSFFGSIPLYQSEVARSKNRGLTVALHSAAISVGYALSNWVGFAFYWVHRSQAQFRVPIAFQMLPALLLTIAVPFMPNSPRWLLECGRYDEAWEVTKRLQFDPREMEEEELRAEFDAIKDQTIYEKDTEVTQLKELFVRPSYRRRLFLASVIQMGTQLVGGGVVNYYQTIIYRSLGIEGYQVLLIAAAYGTVGPIATGLSTAYVDKWGRIPTLIASQAAVLVVFIIVTALSAVYGSSDNRVGEIAVIVFIFLFSISFSCGYNTVWAAYSAEIFPTSIRARGVGIATFLNFCTQIVLSEVSPIALESVEWKYYFVFIGFDVILLVLFCTIFPETKGKSLEEINGLFGDVVVQEFGIHKQDIELAEHKV
ncbi:general substrate transporter [Lipomyces tetrasporus]|uniref:General substrate transporter n=1 Tax=Lipomyces tetrasporus TaxID=54092 RepID=A0AAD7QLS6_9ASCO|nr:general substrate transporter [Lipomyces tetrasporus]KAJ8097647.1 general substrate transporter [Lipomyces tetrasporus]